MGENNGKQSNLQGMNLQNIQTAHEVQNIKNKAKRHTDGQKAHAKMLSISNYQRNINQNYNDVLSHTSQNGHHQKVYKQKMLERGVEKKEPSYTVGGNINWYSHYGEQDGGPLKH